MRKPIGQRLEAALEAFLSHGDSPARSRTQVRDLEQENEALAQICLALEDTVKHEQRRAREAEHRLVYAVSGAICTALCVVAAQMLYLDMLMSLWMLLPAFVAWAMSRDKRAEPKTSAALPNDALTDKLMPRVRLLAAPDDPLKDARAPEHGQR